MGAQDTFRVNGNTHSWGGISFKVAGRRFYGGSEISYGDKLEIVDASGMGRHHAPTRRSAGKYSTDAGKLKFFKESAQALREMLAKLGDGTSYGNVEFEGVVQFIEANQNPMHVQLVGCRLIGDAASHTESPELLGDDLEFKPRYIIRNSVTLFDASEGLP